MSIQAVLQDLTPTLSYEDCGSAILAPVLIPIGEFAKDRLEGIRQRLHVEFPDLAANLRQSVWRDHSEKKFLYVTSDPSVAATMYIAKTTVSSAFAKIDWIVRLDDDFGDYYLISREERRPYFWVWWQESEFKTSLRSAFSDLKYDLAPVRQALPIAIRDKTIHDIDRRYVTNLCELHDRVVSFQNEMALVRPPDGKIMPLISTREGLRLDDFSALRPISNEIANRILKLFLKPSNKPENTH
jgi:hypothetical protein